jgi:hypothetical protein
MGGCPSVTVCPEPPVRPAESDGAAGRSESNNEKGAHDHEEAQERLDGERWS